MSRIFWDTNLFIYLLGDYRDLSAQVVSLRRRMIQRGDHLLTSALTLGEILVKPMEAGKPEWVSRYEAAFAPPAVTVLPFDRTCARIFAQIRQDGGIARPDAIQLACAVRGACDLFVTNDDRLGRKSIAGIHLILPLSRALL